MPVLTEEVTSTVSSGTALIDRTTTFTARSADAAWQAKVSLRQLGTTADPTPAEFTVRAIGDDSWLQGTAWPADRRGTWLRTSGQANVATGLVGTGWETATARALRRSEVAGVVATDLGTDEFSIRLGAEDALELLGYAHGRTMWEQMTKVGGHVPATVDIPRDADSAGYALRLDIDAASAQLTGLSDDLAAAVAETRAGSNVYESTETAFVVCRPAPGSIRTS